MTVERLIQYVPLTEWELPLLYRLWAQNDGLVLRAQDQLRDYLELLRQHPCLSYGARLQTQLIGSVLAGHRSGEGFVQHLMVAPDWRRRGIGLSLAQHALVALRAEGIQRVRIHIEANNMPGIALWQKARFRFHDDMEVVMLGGSQGEPK